MLLLDCQTGPIAVLPFVLTHDVRAGANVATVRQTEVQKGVVVHDENLTPLEPLDQIGRVFAHREVGWVANVGLRGQDRGMDANAAIGRKLTDVGRIEVEGVGQLPPKKDSVSTASVKTNPQLKFNTSGMIPVVVVPLDEIGTLGSLKTSVALGPQVPFGRYLDKLVRNAGNYCPNGVGLIRVVTDDYSFPIGVRLHSQTLDGLGQKVLDPPRIVTRA